MNNTLRLQSARGTGLHAGRWSRWDRFAAVALVCTAAFSSAQAQDQDKPPARTALRVCQDPNNLPFSNVQGAGIENRIAEVFGKALGLPVEYYSFPQRLAFIRNTLRYKLPGQDYPCDIVMGVPVGYDQVSVTKPYYRSTYALVFPQGQGLDQVKSGDDFLKLDPARMEKLRIGVYDRSPASEWLKLHRLVDRGVPYPIMNADPQQYPGEIIEKDLASGKIDAAVVWGPIAGYFAQRVKSPKLMVVPLKSEPGVRFDYEMAMGVRYGEREWKQKIEGLIDSQKPAIQAILKDYGVPVVDDSFAYKEPAKDQPAK
jgi:quinoprotein dehydrogenase-associated probable ABC transporter substrate-binding protein